MYIYIYVYTSNQASWFHGSSLLPRALRKKMLCKFWQEGKCSKGPGCTFAHGDHDAWLRWQGESFET